MKTLIILLLILVVMLLALIVMGRRGFARVSQDRLAALHTQPITEGQVVLPDVMRRFAEAGGAEGGGLVPEIQLIQRAEMRLKHGGNWAALTARQWITTRVPGFVWQARQGAGVFEKFQVIDSFVGGTGLLHVRLLGSIPIATAHGEDVDVGEAMRYLAELPWAPDAILGNAALEWEVLGENRVRVALKDRPEAAVEFILDEAGDISGMWAMRPVSEESGRVEMREWVGTFSDYRQLGDRRIPVRAEVGYVYTDGYKAYWRGEITGLATIDSVKP